LFLGAPERLQPEVADARAWFMPGRFQFCFFPACAEHHSEFTRDIIALAD